MRSLELRRHAPRDPEADRLSEEGEVLALHVGKDLPGGYAAIYSSPARRAAETVAWFLRGLGQQLPQQHGVVDGLATPVEERWRAAAKSAGTGRVDAIREQDPDALAEDSARLAGTVRELITGLAEGSRGLAVGHSPLIEAAVYALTGEVIEPLRECEGVLIEEEGGDIRVGAQYRRE